MSIRIAALWRQHRAGRLLTVALTALLTVGIAVGGTLAFLAARTDPAENVFSPAAVACRVVETFENNVKRDVFIQNTGATDAYIRARIQVTWMRDADAADQTVTAAVPREGVDYTLTLAEDSGWLRLGDTWYCVAPVAPGAQTPVLIASCRLTSGAVVPEGYHLSVEIVSGAVQAAPTDAVIQAWGVRLENGRIAGEVTGA